MKKILSLFLILVICLSSVIIVYATQQKGLEDPNLADYCDKSYDGKCMPIDNCAVYPDAVNCIIPYIQFVFEDVTNEDKWYYEPIYDVWEKGLMEGYGDRWFGVGDELTWVQTVVLAMRTEHYLTGRVYTQKYEKPEHWYSEDLANALEGGIINRIPSDVNAPISRGDMAVIFSRVVPDFVPYAEYTHQTKEEVAYSDLVGVDNEIVGAVNSLKDIGVVNGKSQDFFGVNDTLKREEIATIISRITDIMIEKHN